MKCSRYILCCDVCFDFILYNEIDDSYYYSYSYREKRWVKVVKKALNNKFLDKVKKSNNSIVKKYDDLSELFADYPELIDL